MEDIYINHWAVLVCAISSLFVGALWYSPMLFYKPWQKEAGLNDEQISNANMLKTYGLSFVLAWIMSYNLAFFLGNEGTNWSWGLLAGFLAGFGWASLMFAVIAIFEQRSLKYVLINGGYITVWFSLIGFILGVWR